MSDTVTTQRVAASSANICRGSLSDTSIALSFSRIAECARTAGNRTALSYAVNDILWLNRERSLQALACVRPDTLQHELAHAFGAHADDVRSAFATFAAQSIRGEVAGRAAEELHNLAVRTWNLGNEPSLSALARGIVAGEPSAVAELRNLSRCGADIDPLRETAWGRDAAPGRDERVRALVPLLRECTRGLAREIQHLEHEAQTHGLQLNSEGRIYTTFPIFVAEALADHGAPYTGSLSAHANESALLDFIAEDMRNGAVQREINRVSSIAVHGALLFVGGGHAEEIVHAALATGEGAGSVAYTASGHVDQARISRSIGGATDSTIRDARIERDQHIEDALLGVNPVLAPLIPLIDAWRGQ